MKNPRSICVYCASSTQAPEGYFEAARQVGRILALRRIRLVYGAGRVGLMGACADACLEAGGLVTGVIPRFMVERGWCHPGLTEVVETADMHERKQTMARLADAVIALPGGCGTLEELLEIITWKQLGLFTRPIVVLNVGGYFDPLLQMLGRAIEERFMRPMHAGLWTVARTAAEALQQVERTPEWDTAIGKLAQI